MNRQDGIIALLLLVYQLVRTMPLLSVDAVGESCVLTIEALEKIAGLYDPLTKRTLWYTVDADNTHTHTHTHTHTVPRSEHARQYPLLAAEG
ncbi:hypothetical protein BJX62DRAFT_45929 [Aspergillus germanicus]